MESIEKTKFCKHCGEKIPVDAVICTKCGRQVEEMHNSQPQTIINNNVSAAATASAVATPVATPYVVPSKRAINKWIALLLCIFTFCGHKFYEGKIAMGILYFFTGGLFFIGWAIDIIIILLKPNPYYV